jgi:hypothetical protein
MEKARDMAEAVGLAPPAGLEPQRSAALAKLQPMSATPVAAGAGAQSPRSPSVVTADESAGLSAQSDSMGLPSGAADPDGALGGARAAGSAGNATPSAPPNAALLTEPARAASSDPTRLPTAAAPSAGSTAGSARDGADPGSKGGPSSEPTGSGMSGGTRAAELPRRAGGKREAAAPEQYGTLLIGGEGALRAEIWIDGRSVGFAPRQIEVAVGARMVELRRPDGTRVGPQRVEITARHTLSQPFRLVLPAP